jgi:hypothetical protein
VDRPGNEGQSMFATDATHTPLNSRRIGGGDVRLGGEVRLAGEVRLSMELTAACPRAVSTAADTNNDRANTWSRIFGIGEQGESEARKRAAWREKPGVGLDLRHAK